MISGEGQRAISSEVLPKVFLSTPLTMARSSPTPDSPVWRGAIIFQRCVSTFARDGLPKSLSLPPHFGAP